MSAPPSAPASDLDSIDFTAPPPAPAAASISLALPTQLPTASSAAAALSAALARAQDLATRALLLAFGRGFHARLVAVISADLLVLLAVAAFCVFTTLTAPLATSRLTVLAPLTLHHALVAPGIPVHGYLYDVKTGALGHVVSGITRS